MAARAYGCVGSEWKCAACESAPLHLMHTSCTRAARTDGRTVGAAPLSMCARVCARVWWALGAVAHMHARAYSHAAACQCKELSNNTIVGVVML